MAENTKTKYSDLQDLMDCCSNTVSVLNGFHEQTIKIIEAKKKVAANASSNVAFNQAHDAASAIANLETIDSKNSSAIGEMQPLSQQAQLLLQPTLGQRNVNVAKFEEKTKR
jgi:hypothetical protein